MPRRMYRPPPGESVAEPYERYLYRDLRDELFRRQLGSFISGPGGTRSKAGFVKVLREADKRTPAAASTIQGGKQAAARAETKTSAKPLDAAPSTTARPGASPKTPSVAARTGAGPKTPHTTARAGASPKTPKAGASPTAGRGPQKTVRAVRPRRGCRFRLINVLLSPDFNTRWREMITSRDPSTLEVNAFWLDVHVAFNQQNSLFDALHFQDALFVNVDASVALAHSAARLLQMWIEVVGMYRTAVRSAQQATDAGNTSQSFFDFCAGRLDLLYLHMALLLEAELFEFVMGDTIPGSGSMPVAKIKVIDRTALEVAAETASKPPPSTAAAGESHEAAGTAETAAKETADAAGKPQANTPAKKMRQQKISITVQPLQVDMPTTGAVLNTQGEASSTTGAQGNEDKPVTTPKRPARTPPTRQKASVAAATPATTEARSQPTELTGMPVQNPELADPVLLAAYTAAPGKKIVLKRAMKVSGHAREKKNAGAKAPTTKTSPPKFLTVTTSANTTLSTPTAQPSAPVAAPPISTASSTEPTLAPVIVSQPPPVASVAHPTPESGRPATQSLHRGMDESATESNGDGAASSDFDAEPRDARPRRRSSSKRRRESTETSTDIVAVPESSNSSHADSSTDLIPHPHKRFHTTVSTALTARPSTELMLPPDEWDILENRLRKINENIDRCHRSLTGVEATVSEGYRKTLEADLRFFSAIKQRLQEQLLVVMQSGY